MSLSSYKVNCKKGCFGLIWNLTYEWNLFISQNGIWKENRTEAIKTRNNQEIITFKAKELKSGFRFMIKVIGVLEGVGEKGLVQETFLVNIPPFGGSCKIQPETGFASITEFVISCVGWKEFEKPKNGSGLKFAYRARTVGSSKSFLLHFSNSQQDNRLMLPVGDPSNLQTETIIQIMDSVEDVYEFVIRVEVKPPPIPESKLLGFGFDFLKNYDFKTKFQVGNITEIASSLYSLISIYNVQPSKLLKDDKNLSSAEEEKRKCDIFLQRKEIRKDMMNQIHILPTSNIDETDQKIGVLNSLLLNTKELTGTLLVKKNFFSFILIYSILFIISENFC